MKFLFSIIFFLQYTSCSLKKAKQNEPVTEISNQSDKFEKLQTELSNTKKENKIKPQKLKTCKINSLTTRK